MSTYASIAEDLAAYLRFVEEYDIDWLEFSSQKLNRPTYRFNGHLKHLVQNCEIGGATAKRRMATIVRFYRWLMEEQVLSPKHRPWKEFDRYVSFSGQYGDNITKKITATDLSISTSSLVDPYNERIDDGGKLRPLPQVEQEWLLDALISLGNTEMTLIHLFGLLTGARIQTILTFRVRDVMKEYGSNTSGYLRLPIGPGTQIDTKYNKKLVLHIPLWFYEMLQIYAVSDRARRRRLKAPGGDCDTQYLFLSIRASPFYASKSNDQLSEPNTIRHNKIGQGVRQYITDYIAPFIREKYDRKFHFQFHDTRATFGMNLVDERLQLVEQGKTTLKEVMMLVQARMGHSSVTTTERYLSYRSRLRLVRAVQDEWESKLERMARRALGTNE